MRKILLLVLPLLLSSIVIFAFINNRANKSSSIDPIKIGVDVFPGWAHVFIAQEKGFFEKNGVDVEIILDENYRTIQEKYRNEDLDGAFMVYADSIFAIGQGIDAQVVYISDNSVTGDVIVAKTEFKNIKSLKGQVVGVEGINSFSHMFVLSILKKNGLNEEDIAIKNVSAQKVVVALEKGDIDAGHTYGPGKTEAENKDYATLANAGDVEGIITDTLVFHSEIIKERPDEIRAIVKSLFEAQKFQETNRNEALQILAKALNDSPESIGNGIDAVAYLDLAENIRAMSDKKRGVGEAMSLFESGVIITDFYLNRGQLSTKPDFNSLINPEFLK